MNQATSKALRQRKPLGQRVAANWQLYLLLLVPVVITVIYKYVPMYGIQIAFRDFRATLGYSGSEFVGFKWFERFFTAPTFSRMIKNHVLSVAVIGGPDYNVRLGLHILGLSVLSQLYHMGTLLLRLRSRTA